MELTRDQCGELEDLHIELQRVNSNRLGDWAVMLVLVSPGEGTMKVKIWDNSAARAMVEIMEEEMRAYCNRCKRTTSQHLDGRYRVCSVCGRKVMVK